MALHSDLHSLYQRFDRLIDLPWEEQRRALEQLRHSGDPLALQLEGMLIYHRNQSPTESLFSVDELLDLVKTELPWKLASDLREVSRKLTWESRSRCFHLGQFSLLGCLSVSAIGVTYHAHDQELDRDVVLLLLFPRWGEDSQIQRRSLDASRAVAKIFDPHVAAILGTVKLDGIFAVVRQWIPGMNLDQWLAGRAPMQMHHMVLIGRGIARGLRSLHDENVLHGDLKPANIILRQDSIHPVITDFGTATWISPDDLTKWHGGTRGFVAPEILEGAPPSAQSDLYSLGVLLQWMATGVVDRDATPEDWAQAGKRWIATGPTLDGRPQQLDLQQLDRFRTLVASLLFREPTQRPCNADWVVSRLEECRPPDVVEEEMRGPLWVDVSQRRGRGSHLHRRNWLGHVIGLGATAVSATAGGRWFASRSLPATPLFIPGTPSSTSRKMVVDIPADASSFSIVPSSVFRDLPDHTHGAGLAPTRTGEWLWLSFQKVELPANRYEVGVVQFILFFDADPGQVVYRLEGRLAEFSKSWILLREGTNRFGGFYYESIAAPVGPGLLTDAEFLQIRLGIMVKRTASYPTAKPPVALKTVVETIPCSAGSLDVWDSSAVNAKESPR